MSAPEFVGVDRVDGRVRAQIRRRGSNARETMDVARVYDCGGVSIDVVSPHLAVVPTPVVAAE